MGSRLATRARQAASRRVKGRAAGCTAGGWPSWSSAHSDAPEAGLRPARRDPAVWEGPKADSATYRRRMVERAGCRLRAGQRLPLDRSRRRGRQTSGRRRGHVSASGEGCVARSDAPQSAACSPQAGRQAGMQAGRSEDAFLRGRRERTRYSSVDVRARAGASLLARATQAQAGRCRWQGWEGAHGDVQRLRLLPSAKARAFPLRPLVVLAASAVH